MARFVNDQAVLRRGDGPFRPFGYEFNPKALFGSTEGLWFNFADQSSLYQDNLAATPLTAADQSIGLAADRSRVRSPITTAAVAQSSLGLRPKWGIAPASRRNLLTWTEQFDNAAWGKTAATVSLNATTAPDGTTTADKITEDATSNWHGVKQIASSGISGVFSFYAKAAERSRVWVAMDTPDFVAAVAVFNISNGTVESGAGVITDVGNGWYRCSVVGSVSARGATAAVATDAGVAIRLGDGLSGLFMWGAQLELGSTSTAYQAVTNQFNITQAGLPSYGYIRPDLVDDVMSATIAVAQTGDVLVFGRKGSWIESGVTYGAGSTWSIGVATVTGLPTGLLTAVGDIVGIMAIGRTLTAVERQNALSYYMARGASGWLVAGAEMLTNGNFATDLTGWTNENITRGTSTWVAGQAFLNNTGTGNTVLWQSVTTVIGRPYLVSWDAAAITVPATARCFAGTSSTNGSNLSIISPTPPSSNRAIFVATATTTFISVVAFGATGNATFDNVSLKPLVAA